MQPLSISEARTTQSFTYLAATHVAMVVGALVLAVFWHISGALILAAPSLVILLSFAAQAPARKPRVSVSVDQPRALEGDTVALTVSVVSSTGVALADIELVPDKLLDHEGSLRALTSLDAGQPFHVDFSVVVEEWGVVDLGYVNVRVRDRFGLTSLSTRYRITSKLRVHIHEEAARSLTDPNRFRRLVGSHQSGERGEGCEIADIRPYQPGDRLQSLNWRISARNDEPWITLRHPDRSTTVVLLLDAYQQFGSQRADALRRSIRATLGIARLHLGAQDPVGMMIVGGGVRWFTPELGKLHLHRLTDAMLDLSTRNWSEKRQTQSVLHRLIPKDAIVIGISPLEDHRFANVAISLRSRGQSVHVIEPVTDWPSLIPGYEGSVARSSHAWRIYSLQRQAERRRLSNAGVPVIPWTQDQPIESVLLALRMSQRARSVGGVR